LSGEYLVGIDSGTQNVRVIIFDAQGNIISEGSANHEPPFCEQTGWAEQHPEDLWGKFCEASWEAMSALPAPRSSLAAVGLAAQKAALVAIDQQGIPLRPAFSWMDQRVVDSPVPIPGLSAQLEAAQRASKASWMRTHQPELYRRTHKFLTASGWLLYCLTGKFIDSSGMQVNESPFDAQRLAWHNDPLTYQAHGMPPEKLVDLSPPGALVGHITQKAAAESGLPIGLAVIAGASDKVCEVLGAGTIKPGQVSISYGTLACAVVTVPSYITSSEMQYWTNPGAVPGTWNLEYDIHSGYWLVRWFCEQFAQDQIDEAAALGLSIEQLLSQQAAEIPPGADGLVLTPHWRAPTLAPLGRGLVLGFQAHHTRAHVFRAILEGIIYGLLEGLELLVSETHVPPTEIIVGGGGAQSDLMLQVTADIFGLPTKRPHTIQIGALGAAIDAAVGAGIHPDFQTAVAHMTRSKDIFDPIPANQRRYETIYQEIYKPLYPALEPILRKLNHITDNPDVDFIS
jgi:sugar (pentulose or hexulose) kinase